MFFGRGYTITGTQEATANMRINSVEGSNLGIMKVKFHNTQNQIWVKGPNGCLYGMAVGERYFNMEGRMQVYDIKNKIFAEIAYDTS